MNLKEIVDISIGCNGKFGFHLTVFALELLKILLTLILWLPWYLEFSLDWIRFSNFRKETERTFLFL